MSPPALSIPIAGGSGGDKLRLCAVRQRQEEKRQQEESSKVKERKRKREKYAEKVRLLRKRVLFQSAFAGSRLKRRSQRGALFRL